MRLLIIAVAVLASLGCTHRQLTRSMVNQASTVMAIEYQMVLDNVAMFTVSPNMLPWHVKIKDGTVQINDEGGIPEFGAQWGSSPNFTRGVRAVRSITEQWGADAVTDPRRVKKLQNVYRLVVGLPPMPDPTFFKAFAGFQSRHQNPLLSTEIFERLPTPEPVNPDDAVADQGNPRTAPEAIRQGERSEAELAAVLAELEANVPTGWYCVGRKQDVPKNACFVGHYCDRYVWVMPAGVEGLSEFTLIVLALTELTPRQQTQSRGLVFTR